LDFALMKHTIKITLLTLLAAFAAGAYAAPDGYSINSDSASGDADSLYRINLETGAQTKLGKVVSLGQTRFDVEGLAFSPDGTLYGVDDASMTLFPINTDNGIVIRQQEYNISGLPSGGGNDFGLTFACDGNLYATSVGTHSLYRVNLDGTTNLIGNVGHNISALAAYGNPVQLYGLGNGLKADQTVDSRTLYEIDIQTGLATPRGQLGAAAASYTEAGLAFDNGGQLWAITDRRAVPEGSFGSQILRINTTNGNATLVSTTTETGFESLAITVPRGCSAPSGEAAEFKVQKRFVDGNDITPVTLNISCTTGLPLIQSQTVIPQPGVYNDWEINFIVESFADGEMSCTITETPVDGYTGSYTCLGESNCAAAQSPDSCVFTEIASGSENLCQVQNYPDPVPFTINKQWIYEVEEIGLTDAAEIGLECVNPFDGDGEFIGNTMYWSWTIHGDQSLTAMVYPDYTGNTYCRASEAPFSSAIESDNGCPDWVPVGIGDAPKSCDIINTVFLEGIPTLSEYGMLLFALLMLATGAVAVRRI
jgi:hypothetical protein